MLAYFFETVSVLVSSGLLTPFFTVACGAGLVSLASYLFGRRCDY